MYYLSLRCIYCVDYCQCRVFVLSQQGLCSNSTRVSIRVVENTVLPSHRTFHSLIFAYSPAYNLAFTALVYSQYYAVHATSYYSLTQRTAAFVVELFPFHVRAKGIAIYQQWCRGAALLSQFVDPIGLDVAGISFPPFI